jgi:serine O-acetyltransferase
LRSETQTQVWECRRVRLQAEKRVLENIRCDLRRFAESEEPLTTRSLLRLVVYSFGLQAVLAYRFGRWLQKGTSSLAGWPRLMLFPIYWLLVAYVRMAYDIRLDLTAELGRGLHVWHFGGIRVANCRLGENCTIHQRVRIGTPAGHPKPWIADNVWIGPHAQILEPVRIGAGATIGAGAVVIRDVPERTLSMGNPARVVMMGYDNRVKIGAEKVPPSNPSVANANH